MILQPARQHAEKGNDEILDLDVILSHRVKFRFQGQEHSLLPITSKVFFEYWDKVVKFKSKRALNAKDYDAEFFAMVNTVCDSITLKDIQSMDNFAKTRLIHYITEKITGTGFMEAAVEKKNLAIPQSA